MRAKVILILVVVAVIVTAAVWTVSNLSFSNLTQRGTLPKETSDKQSTPKKDPEKQAKNRRAEVFRLSSEVKGKDVSKLLPYLEDESPRVRLAAAREIIAKDAAGNFQRLVKLLRDEDGTIRASVAQL